MRGLHYDHSRRLFLLGGIGGAAAWKGLAQQLAAPAGKVADPSCVLTGELEEGPYYLDLEMLRRDITEHKPGVPLRLRISVVDAKSCNPLPNAAVDIWHCDAVGLYSGFTASAPPDGAGRGPGRGPNGPGGPGFGPPPGPPPGFDFAGRGPGRGGPGRGRGATDKFTFLRGVQITGRNGIAEFETVYPGWYVGRTIHIHTKIHLGGAAADNKYSGGHVTHTGQFFFPEDVTEAIAKLDPYMTHKTYRTLNEQDGIYRQAHSSGGMLALNRVEKSLAAGMAGAVTIAVDPEATPRVVGIGRGGPGPGR